MPKTIAARAEFDQSEPIQNSDETSVCPACGDLNQPAGTFQFKSGRGLTRWARCAACHTYFMAEGYDSEQETDHTRNMAWGNRVEGVALNHRKRNGFVAALDRIESFGYGAGSKILDVGCSFGGILVEARRRGFDCAGVDIVPEAIEWMKSEGFRAQQCASLRDCTLFTSQAPADVVTVLDAHIYWPDQPAELRAARDLLRDDGLLLIRAVTKSAYITSGRMVGAVSPGFSKKFIRRAIADHRFSMPLKSLLRTVEEAGFEVLSASPRGAQHTSNMPLSARAAFAMGTLLWHGLGVSIAPTTLVFARKKPA
jgi:2-polyprenyl-3-methyl-5-hydroxy-6-metoxy-1,4-benzoquinol methylase